MENVFLISPNMLFGFLKYQNFFSFLSSVLKCQEENENGIIVKSSNGLHKLMIAIFGITQEPLHIKASKMETSEYIWLH